ncbi:MAG: ABC transporter permease subunit [Anaerolineae bacterium]|jgi:His/Glu/Gln/Arg/opine family amino acid ABC transporter permease subunit
MTTETLRKTTALERPRTAATTLFGWTDSVPWWVLVLLGLGTLVLLFVLSPARVDVLREVPTTAIPAGGTLTYTLEVRNAGPAEAVKLVLTEQLPEGVELVSADPKPTSVDGSLLTWELAPLKGDRTALVTVEVAAQTAGQAAEIMRTAAVNLTWTTVSVDIIEFLAIGARVTITVTLYSFALAIVLGLVAGLGRVTKQPAGFSSVLRPDFALRGVIRVVIGLGVYLVASRFVAFLPPFSPFLGTVLAVVLYLAPRILHPYTLSTVYVEVFRGVPMLVQVLYLGFVIRPFLKGFLSEAMGTQVEFSEFSAAVVGLGLGYGAYLAEVFRAGIQSIHRGQMEAARSLGMTYGQAMRYVILPQAIRRVLPPLANDGVALLKDSSFVSVLSVADLTRQGRLYMSRTYRAFESWNMVAFSYLILTFLFSGVARAIERRMSRDER